MKTVIKILQEILRDIGQMSDKAHGPFVGLHYHLMVLDHQNILIAVFFKYSFELPGIQLFTNNAHKDWMTLNAIPIITWHG